MLWQALERARPSTTSAGPRLLVLGEDLGRAVARRAPPGTELAIESRGGNGDGARVEGVGGAAGRMAEPDAVLGTITRADGLAALVAGWSRRARDGGLVALASPAAALLSRPVSAEALTQAFVHGGLVDIEQRVAGRIRVTLGRVRRPALLLK